MSRPMDTRSITTSFPYSGLDQLKSKSYGN